MKRLVLAAATAALLAAPAVAASFRDRLPQDEVIYFLLPDRFDNADPSNDRGGLSGDRMVTGFDPTDKGFYHGGDLKGVIRRLGYLQDLGVTAIWVAPVFGNKAVQGPPGHASAGYHGYWIEDFLNVDPHLGTNDDFKALVDAAHARGMKVIMDIVVNHTADVIRYRECTQGQPCAYRGRADYPFQRRGGVNGKPINPGFAGDDELTPGNYARLTDPTWAYTPYVPAAEAHAKKPDWLNDPIFYHDRGDSTFAGESSLFGDFSGLDDVATEHPRVVQGMIDIYGGWIDRYGIDGFRIDTERHVNPEFWQAFVPAMLARAEAKGIPHFHIFGEVLVGDATPAALAEHVNVDKIPAVIDFAFGEAVRETVGGTGGTDIWQKTIEGDALYAGGFATAVTLPTVTGNHDVGRLASFIRHAFPEASDAEVLARVELSNALLFTFRGVPTIYSGDEQGFVGHGGDQDAREDMFASRVASYNDNRLLGTTTTTATAHFGENNPLFRQIASLARLRLSHPALTRGPQRLRVAGDKPGLLVLSRFDPGDGHELLLAFNTSAAPVSGQALVETRSTAFRPLAGQCAARATAPGSVAVTLPAFGYAICEAVR